MTTQGDLPDYSKYRARYGPRLHEHFDLALEAWKTHPEIREVFPGFTTFNKALREPSSADRRAEAHALIRRYTDYEIGIDERGLPILRPGQGKVVPEQPETAADSLPVVVISGGSGGTGRRRRGGSGTGGGDGKQRLYVKCPACSHEFTPSSKALRKSAIVAGGVAGGALSGAAIGASAGTGIGIAGGGIAMAGTIPVGVVGGVIGGTVLGIGSKLGADWAMTKVTCPSCGQEFRIQHSR